jgi:hypothetical protein
MEFIERLLTFRIKHVPGAASTDWCRNLQIPDNCATAADEEAAQIKAQGAD